MELDLRKHSLIYYNDKRVLLEGENYLYNPTYDIGIDININSQFLINKVKDGNYYAFVFKNVDGNGQEVSKYKLQFLVQPSTIVNSNTNVNKLKASRIFSITSIAVTEFDIVGNLNFQYTGNYDFSNGYDFYYNINGSKPFNKEYDKLVKSENYYSLDGKIVIDGLIDFRSINIAYNNVYKKINKSYGIYTQNEYTDETSTYVRASDYIFDINENGMIYVNEPIKFYTFTAKGVISDILNISIAKGWHKVLTDRGVRINSYYPSLKYQNEFIGISKINKKLYVGSKEIYPDLKDNSEKPTLNHSHVNLKVENEWKQAKYIESDNQV
jgi:hypothetical protein|nr:MAG TPA: hypothetical protein [Bacteriophage sp.]